jgi:hypothetical protein
MEMTQKQLTSEEKKEMDKIPFQAETRCTKMVCGYSVGEWERKHIHIGKGSKEGEVEFSLYIVESGMNDIDVTIHGSAQLNGNRFRYTEKGYEFEVAVYTEFIMVKTISGDLNGVKVDGVYPKNYE